MFIFVLTLITSISLAQENEGDTIIYKKQTEIDFEGIEVEGALVKPQGSLIQERRSISFNPMIRIRTDFNPEMSTSINNIK